MLDPAHTGLGDLISSNFASQFFFFFFLLKQHRCIFFHSSGGWKSKVKMPEGLVSPEASLLSLYTSHVCPSVSQEPVFKN